MNRSRIFFFPLNLSYIPHLCYLLNLCYMQVLYYLPSGGKLRDVSGVRKERQWAIWILGASSSVPPKQRVQCYSIIDFPCKAVILPWYSMVRSLQAALSIHSYYCIKKKESFQSHHIFVFFFFLPTLGILNCLLYADALLSPICCFYPLSRIRGLSWNIPASSR